jgi:hypothetical protein
MIAPRLALTAARPRRGVRAGYRVLLALVAAAAATALSLAPAFAQPAAAWWSHSSWSVWRGGW